MAARKKRRKKTAGTTTTHHKKRRKHHKSKMTGAISVKPELDRVIKSLQAIKKHC